LLEGLPLVLIEAMAVGVPVVAPRVAGIPELVHDGRNGLLFTPSNWTELAERMSRLLDDPALCVQIAARASRTVASEFDIRSAAAKLSELFGSVANKQIRRRMRHARSFGLREAIVFSTLAILIAVAIALRSGSSSPRPQPLAGSAAAGER
jgi:spore maturation protein CgeB